MQTYTVKIDVFEGPIGLLLRLIEENKLHISRVSLAAVADNFLTYLGEMTDDNNKDLVANFVAVAATLMLIKSVSLLPNLQIAPEEERGIEELQRRLQIYRQLKELSRHVQKRFGRQQIFFRPESGFVSVFSPTDEVTIPNLSSSLKRLIDNLPYPENIPEVVVRQTRRLDDVIAELINRVKKALKLTLQEFVGEKKERISLILSFLSILELVKRGLVKAEQADHFQNITIETLACDDGT